MNTNDVDEVPEPREDMLVEIFRYQRELMKKYEHIEARNSLLETADVPVDLDDPLGQARLKNFAWRIVEELGEAMSCLKNKPWKQTHMQTDRAHYVEEIADAFHFFVELCILSGLDAQDLYDIYYRKFSVNKFRQRSMY